VLPAGVRVTHVSPLRFGEGGLYGGGERYAFELARHMAEVTPTRMVTFGQRPERYSVGRLNVTVLGRPWHVRGQRLNPLHPGLVRAVAGADVVHCHQRYVLASSLSAVLGRLTGRRVFATDLGGGGWDVSAYMPTHRWFHGHLHISEYSRRISGQDGDPRSRVVWGGVDVDKFSPGPAVRRDGTVLYVGRLLPLKGVIDLVEAADPDTPVELIGKPYHARYYQGLQAAAAGKRVTFRHDAADADLTAAYRRALCVVLPSVYRSPYGEESKVPELLGQTPLEGMACGAPAIVTNVASLPEVVEDGVTGFVVPPNDPPALREKLRWLRDHPDEARRMGERARQRVLERFTWGRVVDRCLAAYRGEPA
jgi:glycosyltransferase involved in cell wall biosynthesis